MDQQPFYVGQKVVCITTEISKDGKIGVREGQLYFVKKVNQCKCKFWKVDIGVAVDYIGDVVCEYCKHKHDRGSTVWFPSKYFAPVQEGFQAITFEKVMEQELSSVN